MGEGDSGMSRQPPWIVEAKKVWGLHEVRDKAALQRWLRSDGPTLGDPTKLPWCGDFVETAIKNSLPNEPFPGPVGDNPYWARNWLYFGEETRPCLWSILVFKRGSGGHVGFAAGIDDTHYYVLGGNQSNAVNIVRIARNRLLGARWPSTVSNPLTPLPKMSANGIPTSTNEF
jgi:uncharacterized protein (TIGR02594 family)